MHGISLFLPLPPFNNFLPTSLDFQSVGFSSLSTGWHHPCLSSCLKPNFLRLCTSFPNLFGRKYEREKGRYGWTEHPQISSISPVMSENLVWTGESLGFSMSRFPSCDTQTGPSSQVANSCAANELKLCKRTEAGLGELGDLCDGQRTFLLLRGGGVWAGGGGGGCEMLARQSCQVFSCFKND